LDRLGADLTEQLILPGSESDTIQYVSPILQLSNRDEDADFRRISARLDGIINMLPSLWSIRYYARPPCGTRWKDAISVTLVGGETAQAGVMYSPERAVDIVWVADYLCSEDFQTYLRILGKAGLQNLRQIACLALDCWA
jgi:hypothetical protein